MPGRSTSTVAELMRDWLLDRGVASARVIVELELRQPGKCALYGRYLQSVQLEQCNSRDFCRSYEKGGKFV
jgi:hypothetical protein